MQNPGLDLEMEESIMSGTIYRPEEKHPQPWQEHLNPDAGAGLNHGIAGQAQEQKAHLRTMHDIKDLHRRFHDWNDADLKQVPVLAEGSRLEAKATYLNSGSDRAACQWRGDRGAAGFLGAEERDAV
jgi:hypothetical protein